MEAHDTAAAPSGDHVAHRAAFDVPTVESTDDGRDPRPDEGDYGPWSRLPALAAVMADWSRRPRLHAVLPHLVLGLCLALTTALAVLLARDLWFLRDDWDFLLRRGTVPGTDVGLLAPHNEHLMVAVAAITRGIYEVVGLREYLPYAVAAIVFHVMAVVVAYLVLRRLTEQRWVPVVTCLAFMLLGPVSTTVMFDGNIAFTGAHAFGLLAILFLLEAPRGPRLVLVWASLIAALAFNGTAIPAVVVAVVFAGLRHGWRSAVGVLSAPLLAFLAWTVEHSSGPTIEAFDSPQRFLQLSEFVWTGLVEAASTVTLTRALGPVLLAAAFLAPYVLHSPVGLRQWAVAGHLGALGSVALIAATPRFVFGPGVAASDRYVYAVACHLLPSAAILLAAGARAVTVNRTTAAVATVLAVGMVGMRGIEQQVNYSGGVSASAMDFKREVYGLLEATDEGQRILVPHRQDWADTEFDASLMIRPEARRELPAGAATVRGRVDAESEFMTRVDKAPLGLPPPLGITAAVGLLRESTVTGCRFFDVEFGEGSVDLTTGPAGGQVRIAGPAKNIRTEILRDATRSKVVRTWPTKGPVIVGTSAKDATLRLTVDSVGRYLVCGG